MRLVGVLAALIAVWLVNSGCAPSIQRVQQNLDSQIGRMTFDQAMMAWGQPASITQGNEIVVATWTMQRTGAVAMPVGNMVYATPVSHGETLQLAFDKQTKVMKHWRYNRW